MAASDSSAVGSDKSLVERIAGIKLKPITNHNVLFYYLPIHGAVSYTSLSINVMNPSLVVRLFPKRDVTNMLLFSTLLGTGLYLYDRPHLKVAPFNTRVAYSGFGAVMFSFGSVLLWAVLRSVLPETVTICTAVGVVSGIGLIKAGTSYLDFIDSQVKKTASKN